MNSIRSISIRQYLLAGLLILVLFGAGTILGVENRSPEDQDDWGAQLSSYLAGREAGLPPQLGTTTTTQGVFFEVFGSQLNEVALCLLDESCPDLSNDSWQQYESPSYGVTFRHPPEWNVILSKERTTDQRELLTIGPEGPGQMIMVITTADQLPQVDVPESTILIKDDLRTFWLRGQGNTTIYLHAPSRNPSLTPRNVLGILKTITFESEV